MISGLKIVSITVENIGNNLFFTVYQNVKACLKLMFVDTFRKICFQV